MSCPTTGPGSNDSDLNEVIGAGPSGLAAAITFARAGRAVRVLERHHRVGQRFHGDMQGLENWSRSEGVLDQLDHTGIDAGFDYRPFHEVTLYDSRLRATVAHTQRPMFYLVRRGSGGGTLDSALLEQARSAGADVLLGQYRRIVAAFCRLAPGLRLAHPQPFGGYAALFAPLRFTEPAGRWYVGEAAGLQSGFRAATCAMQAEDYEGRARQEFGGRRAAGLADRTFFEAIPTGLLVVALRRGAARDDLLTRMGRHWAPNPTKTVFGRLAEYRLRTRTPGRDKGCKQASCSCLRCACVAHALPGRAPRREHGSRARARPGSGPPTSTFAR